MHFRIAWPREPAVEYQPNGTYAPIQVLYLKQSPLPRRTQAGGRPSPLNALAPGVTCGSLQAANAT